jgi:hypothetical protein
MWRAGLFVLFLLSAAITMNANHAHIIDRHHDMSRQMVRVVESAGGTILPHNFSATSMLGSAIRFKLSQCNKDIFVMPFHLSTNAAALLNRLRETYDATLVEKRIYLGRFFPNDATLAMSLQRLWQQLRQLLGAPEKVKLGQSLILFVPAACESNTLIDWSPVWLPETKD